MFLSAADSGDFAGYIMKQGGPETNRRDQPITVAKVWSDEPGYYGDPKGYSEVGVTDGIVTVQTKIYEWAIGFSPLHMGEPAVLCEASSAPPGRGPVGGAPTSAQQAWVPNSRVENPIVEFSG